MGKERQVWVGCLRKEPLAEALEENELGEQEAGEEHSLQGTEDASPLRQNKRGVFQELEENGSHGAVRPVRESGCFPRGNGKPSGGAS